MEPASDPEPSAPPASAPARLGLLAPVLFFLSGFAGLTYQVLWQRELGLLFGNTTQATATTLAVFFLGLAVGAFAFGRRAGRMRDPWRSFGALELGVGLTALLLPLLLPVYRGSFGALYGALGDVPGVFVLVKFLLAALVLAPPAILIGGTLPVLTEAVVRRGGGLARQGIVLYAVNTAGAMVGAGVAGFVLPRLLGYRVAYLVAVGASLGIGAVALAAGRRRGRAPAPAAALPAGVPADRRLLALAALSGFTTLGLEVLWTRMAALALVNSVYAFAGVLVLFLAALALAAALARGLSAWARDPLLALQAILLVAGLATLFSGTLFRLGTGSPPAVGHGEDFGGYLLAMAGVVTLTLLPAALAMGLVFPYLLRVEELRGTGPAGPRIGRLAAVNTGAALAGSLAAGFLLPALLGLWASISLLAGLYGVALLVAPYEGAPGRIVGAAGGALLLILALAHGLIDGSAGERWDLRRDEIVLGRYEGSAGMVRVVKVRGALKLRFNNSYTLGGTAQPRWEQYQAHIPLCLHGAPKKVCFLGMGTGITAGAALHHDVETVRVAEIVPEAVTAAREHFGPWLNGLFEDERTDVVVEDARTMLRGMDDRYDVIVGDLFLPWRPGTALLYSEEHFDVVRRSLAKGGLFAQWLPLYQLTRAEYDGIVASFVRVFGHATLFRGDFFGRRPIVALVGRTGAYAWDGDATVAAWQRLEAKGAVDFGAAVETLPFMFYAGRIPSHYVAKGRRITDAQPWIEFESPRLQRARAHAAKQSREQRRRVLPPKEARVFHGVELAEYQWSLLKATMPDEDPFLRTLSETRRRYVIGGMHLYDHAVYRQVGPRERSTEALWGYYWGVPEDLQPDKDRWIE